MALSGGLVERFCSSLGAVRGQINTAAPGAITSYASGLLSCAKELGKLLEQLRAGRADVAKSWKRGPGRDKTLERMDTLLKQLATTIATVNKLVPLLNNVAGTLAKSQRGFAMGVQTGSARIASILATGNPGAKQAAAASAAQTTSSLSGLISTFGKALEALGVKGISPLFDMLGQVAGQIQQVSQQASGGASTLPSTLPATLPQQQPLPAFTQYPWTGQAGQQQMAGEANSWIPISQPGSAGGSSSGQVEVTVTTKAGDTTTVRAVAGRDASFDLKVGSEDVHIAIDGDGDGRVAGRTT
jgi:hypothetical protein